MYDIDIVEQRTAQIISETDANGHCDRATSLSHLFYFLLSRLLDFIQLDRIQQPRQS